MPEEQLAACDFTELAQLAARARAKARLWEDVFARAVSKALKTKE